LAATRDFTIGEISEQTGVHIETVRYYEKVGLLPPPPRTEGGHRLYADDHLKRIIFIRRSRELGFTLDDIRNLLGLVEGGYTCGPTCRFRNLDSSVPMMEPAKDRVRNNVSEPLDRACAGRVLPKRNMCSHLIIINGIFRKDSAKVFRVEHDQMISALAPDRSDQAFSISVLPGRAERGGPVPDTHCSHPSLERAPKMLCHCHG
jgi:DNA-binding transcriptional MerR regulator